MQLKNILRLFVLIFFSSVTALKVSAQFYAENKEKIYVQTNHVFFKAGETLFFKLYVVKAQDNTPTRISNVVYTELVSPSGTVLQKASYAVTDGYAQGSFDLSAQQPGGIYKIRAYTSWMRNENEDRFFIKEITLQQVIAPRILMKLDFPEKGYGAGDEVKARFSMRSLEDLPIRNHSGKFTVSIGGEAIQNTAFKTGPEGKAVISFSLPGQLRVNDGLLNVQVEYDGYTESISRSIPIVLNKIDLQFMPEGGTLVNGITTNIAFKALNENGKAADIRGVIKDGNGTEVARFESYHFGMGKFSLTPQNGACYKAYITSPANIDQAFDLPAASAEGVVMQLEKSKKKITLLLHTSFAREVKLKVSARNTTFHLQHLTLQQGMNEITLDENIFPAGICQFSLYAINDLPLAERLAFLNEDVQLQVKITPGKKQYGPREKVSLAIRTTDENGKPLASNISLAVVDDKLWTFADDKQDHILSWLLMSSELKGKVEEPQFYFKKDEPKAVPALDILMMTQGYRYFDYTEYVVKNNVLQFLPDQDHILSGRILDKDNNPVSARVFLVNTVFNGKGMEIKTESDGLFFFSNLIAGTGYYLFAQCDNKAQTLKIEVLQNGLGYNMSKANAMKRLLAKPVDLSYAASLTAAVPGKKGDKTPPSPLVMQGEMNRKQNLLSEVVVTGYGQSVRLKQLGYASVSIKAAEIAPGVKLQNALAGKVAGVNIATVNNGVFADDHVMLRGIRTLTGNNEPLYVVNGIPTEKLQLDHVSPGDINYITVLKSGEATSLFGSTAANGAIIIETKKLYRENFAVNISDKHRYASQMIYTQSSNFTPARNFYVPAYQTTFTEERTDFRETIYWNPVIQTDKEGKATVTFFNSDANTTFRAIAEGIGYNGKTGRNESTYSVSSLLQADVKIPPSLTVGDQALLPLVIKNNSDEEQQITVGVNAPASVKIGAFTNSIEIKAGGSAQVLVPAEITAALNDHIDFTVSTVSAKEKLHLPIQAADKGFPVRLTFSGNNNGTHTFPISSMIPGTLNTKLKLFNNVEGQLLDGIESMLREPYGCFEQTSSSTYPNILILKYLKEKGKSSPELEKRALDLITRGYNRLIGFETAMNGFEWFGKTPPHEALTAYGLLEFTDMQEFIDVDTRMLERTKKFLLKRRNGSGTFELMNRGYDQFASVPNRVANIYIVYALTRAGIGKEIRKEYETALTNALASNDGYQLAMMANTAYLQKDMPSYEKMLKALAAVETKEIMNAETSVVNSRSASLKVETFSLYAMALMKAEKPDMMKIASLITKILNEKSYYGYGSTQSTVMALQTLVDYSKLISTSSNNNPVTFLFNGKTAGDYSRLSEMISEGNNTINVIYQNKQQAVPYGIEIAYSTLVPPNDAKAELKLSTTVAANATKVSETVRMTITVSNTRDILQPMAIAKIGIPAGLSAQPWQLKEIMEKNHAAYYELFDNYLVFYWMGFAPNETKTINLDLKAEVPGKYRAKASNVYLYYTPEYKNWAEGTEIEVKE